MTDWQIIATEPSYYQGTMRALLVTWENVMTRERKTVRFSGPDLDYIEAV